MLQSPDKTSDRGRTWRAYGRATACAVARTIPSTQVHGRRLAPFRGDFNRYWLADLRPGNRLRGRKDRPVHAGGRPAPRALQG